MGWGGARPGAGRKKGQVTKFNELARKEALAQGISPLDFMLAVLRDENESRAVRLDAAKAAAPYLHARLNAIEHSGEATVKYEISAEPMTAEQWKAEIEAENSPPLLEAGKKV
jgi:hypothetical protein